MKSMMNTIKRFAGIIWMALGPITCYFLISTALSEIEKKPVLDTKIQWGVFVLVFIPIAIGIMIFGYYALKGEYDHLPESSTELED
jgi:purine-cytosine permease-like protein